MDKKNIRIFISSPHDVLTERNIAKKIILEVGELYASYADIEIIMWENLPLSSDSTFQEGINYFLNKKPIDVAVFILWTRLGTPLCTKFRKPDGSCYNSGTEYEFDMMMQLYKSKGSPRILTYIKDSNNIVTTTNSVDDLKAFIEQKDLLNAFIKENFRDDESNSNYAYMQFGEKVSFEQKFKAHITTTIKSIVGETKDLKEWKGNPYVGLKSFDYDQSSIFFGRTKLIYETVSKLIDVTQPENRKSLIVLGESGSGKSSFVKAGLIPFLCSDKGGDYKYIVSSPSMFSGKMYDCLLNKLISEYLFLKDSPFIKEILGGTSDHDNFEHLRYAMDQHQHKHLILYIDQFEEFFDDSLYSAEERKKAIHLLHGIVSSERIHLFISMRNDFYQWFSREEELQQLKSRCIVVDITALGISELTQIVEEPARKAALNWEIDNKGESLNKQIIADALSIKELPLIEFALSELYERRNEKDYLTFDAYNKIGKLEGAVINYANDFYNKLSDKERLAFSNLLSYVVGSSSTSKGTFTRKTSLRENAESDEITAELIDKLISSHLFVSGKDSNGNATITIVHEVLINSWDVISEWTKREQDFLNRNNYYENIAQNWADSGKSKKKLLNGRASLLEAEYHLFKNGKRLQPDVHEFLNQSIKKDVRKGLIWRIFVIIILTLYASLSAFFKTFQLIYHYTRDNMAFSWVYYEDCFSLIMIFGSLLLILVYNVIVRIKCKPKYLTIRHSIIVWAIAILMTVAFFIDLFNCDEDIMDLRSVVSSLMFLWLICGFFVLASLFLELLKRKKWSINFVSYIWSDDAKSSVKSLCLAILLMFLLIYINQINLENEQTLKTINLGLEKKPNNTLQDTHIINLSKITLEYLQNDSRIEDTTGNFESLEYAQCLLNLGRPYDALEYLYPDEDWSHHLFWIICSHHAGIHKDVEHYMELYLNDNRYDKACSFTTADLIWQAEEMGRFDLAEKAFDIVKDTLPESLTTPSYVVKRGHIHLFNGDFENAVSLYKEAIDKSYDYGSVPEMITRYIQNDFYVFSRKAIIPDGILEKACGMVGVKFQPTFLPKDAVLINDEYRQRLSGVWVLNNSDKSKALLTIREDLSCCVYRFYDSQGTMYCCYTSDMKIVRDKNDDVLIEELNLYDNSHTLCKLLSIEDKTMELEVLHSFNPREIGRIRRYTR